MVQTNVILIDLQINFLLRKYCNNFKNISHIGFSGILTVMEQLRRRQRHRQRHSSHSLFSGKNSSNSKCNSLVSSRRQVVVPIVFATFATSRETILIRSQYLLCVWNKIKRMFVLFVGKMDFTTCLVRWKWKNKQRKKE